MVWQRSGSSSWETAFFMEWVVTTVEMSLQLFQKAGGEIEEGVGKEAIISIRLVLIFYFLPTSSVGRESQRSYSGYRFRGCAESLSDAYDRHGLSFERRFLDSQ